MQLQPWHAGVAGVDADLVVFCEPNVEQVQDIGPREACTQLGVRGETEPLALDDANVYLVAVLQGYAGCWLRVVVCSSERDCIAWAELADPETRVNRLPEAAVHQVAVARTVGTPCMLSKGTCISAT